MKRSEYVLNISRTILHYADLNCFIIWELMLGKRKNLFWTFFVCIICSLGLGDRNTAKIYDNLFEFCVVGPQIHFILGTFF